MKKLNYNISRPAQASFWFMVCNVIQKCVTFFTMPIFTRVMSTYDYGIVSLFGSWQGILSIIFTMNLYAGVYNKGLIVNENDKDGYTSSLLSLSTCITLFFFCLFLIFKEEFCIILGLELNNVYLLFMSILGINAFCFWTARNRFEYKYQSTVLLTFSSFFTSTILGLIVILGSKGNLANARIKSNVFVDFLIGFICYFLILKKGKCIYKKEYWKHAFKYNLPLIPHYMSMQILNQSDRIMINNFCGSDYAGIYSVAYQISFTINMFVTAIHASFSPWVYQNMKDGEMHKVSEVTKVILLGMGIICIFMAMVAPELIYIFGGEKYAEAVDIVPPVAFSVLFNMLYSIVALVAFYYERTHFIMVGTLVAAVLNIILNGIFIPIFGFVAAGYTTLICYIVYACIHYMFMKKVCRQEKIERIVSFRVIGGCIWGAMITCIFSGVIHRWFVIRYFIIILIGSCMIVKNKDAILSLIQNKSG